MLPFGGPSRSLTRCPASGNLGLFLWALCFWTVGVLFLGFAHVTHGEHGDHDEGMQFSVFFFQDRG